MIADTPDTAIKRSTIALLAILIVAQSVPFLWGIRLTADDVSFHYGVFTQPFFATIWDVSVGQGRISNLQFMAYNFVGNYFADFLAFRIVSISIFAGSAVLFALWLRRLSGAATAGLYLVLFFSLVTLAGLHMPPNSYYLPLTTPVLMVIAGRLCLGGTAAGPRLSRARRAAGLVLFLVGILGNEYAMIFGVVMVTAETLVRHAPIARAITGLVAIRDLVSAIARDPMARIDAALLAGASAAWAGFRMTFPSNYDGNRFDGIGAGLKIFWLQARHALGGMSTNHLSDRLLDNSAAEWAISIGCGVIAAYLARAFLLQRAAKSEWMLATFGFALAFLVTLPVALTAKYQLWCDHGICTHTDSRFAFFGIVLVLAALALRLVRSSRFHATGLSLLIGGLSVVTAGLNYDQADRFDKANVLWKDTQAYACAAPMSGPNDEAFLDRLMARGETTDPWPSHQLADPRNYWQVYLDHRRWLGAIGC